ncbi:coenzyme F420-0:L-glutamate ligase [Patescibacteria group bacterium]|nr:coenzyme F420-0:L-glutamate ligase [Patescibacteria group bacterium]
MQIIPIKTPLLENNTNLAQLLTNNAEFEDGDILAISSKAISTVEGNAIELSKIEVTDEGKQWADKCGKTPQFRQAVLNETDRLNGKVLSYCPNAMLTQLKPDGLKEGIILAPNAGLDESNVAEGFAIGWPLDPVKSIRDLRSKIENITGKKIAVILTDSCCRPRRIGVSAYALTVSGIDPLEDRIGKKDLFGKELLMTMESRADQLATATNMLMGNTNESIPAAIVRDHGLELSDFEGWVDGIEPEEDLFAGIL